VSKNFKPIFSYNDDLNKNAYLNWRMLRWDRRQNLNAIAHGYYDAAISLAQSCVDDNCDKKADELIFPILFNMDHSIELYLKSIMWSAHWLNDDYENSFKRTHDLQDLYQKTKEAIHSLGKEDEDNFIDKTDNLSQYICELYSLLHPAEQGQQKDNLDLFRYPMSRDQKPYFYAENSNENVTIDLENFIVRFQEIGKTLNCLADYYDELVDKKIEVEADTRQLEDEYQAELEAELYFWGYEF